MGYSNGILESDVKGEGGVRGEQGLPGIGFKLTDDGDFDIDSKRLTDVGKPTENSDATTKAYVDDAIGHHTGNFYHLRRSFTFYDSSDNLLPLSTDSITGLVTDYKHGYYKIPKSGDDSTFSTLDIKVTNNLPQSTYSALFYLYGYRNGNLMRGVDLGPILFSVVGTDDYDILKYDDDDSTETTDHTKAIIWFTSNGKQGSIELGLRFFDKSITHFVILSRCVEGKVNLGFSSNIFNVPSTVGDVTLYFEDINMNSRSIKDLGGPIDDGDVTNKKYVDTKLDKKGGTMSGDLDMSDNEIINLKDIDTITGSNLKNAVNALSARNISADMSLLYYSIIVNGVETCAPAAPSFSYKMNRFIHNNEKQFRFDENVKSTIASVEISSIEGGEHYDKRKLGINYKGKYILTYRDMFKNKGKVKFELVYFHPSSTPYKTIYSDEMDFSSWTTKEIEIELFVDKIVSYLRISTTDSLLLDGIGANSQFFQLLLASDVLNKREAANTYLKLDGSKPMTGDLDIGRNNILSVENLVNYKDTDPYDYRVKDVKSVVYKEYLNENFYEKG